MAATFPINKGGLHCNTPKLHSLKPPFVKPMADLSLHCISHMCCCIARNVAASTTPHLRYLSFSYVTATKWRFIWYLQY